MCGIVKIHIAVYSITLRCNGLVQLQCTDSLLKSLSVCDQHECRLRSARDKRYAAIRRSWLQVRLPGLSVRLPPINCFVLTKASFNLRTQCSIRFSKLSSKVLSCSALQGIILTFKYCLLVRETGVAGQQYNCRAGRLSDDE